MILILLFRLKIYLLIYHYALKTILPGGDQFNGLKIEGGKSPPTRSTRSTEIEPQTAYYCSAEFTLVKMSFIALVIFLQALLLLLYCRDRKRKGCNCQQTDEPVSTAAATPLNSRACEIL